MKKFAELKEIGLNKRFCTILCLLFTISSGFLSAQKQNAPVDSSTIIPDTLLFRLEKYQAGINEMNAANKKGYDGEKIRAELTKIRANVAQIDSAMQVNRIIPDNKNLLNYRLMLTDAQLQTGAWRKSLSKYNAELQRMSEQVIQFSRDSLLLTDHNDSTQRKLYADQISDLRVRLQNTGKVTVANLDTVSKLLADVSAVYFQTVDLQSIVDDYLRESGKSVLSKEYKFLWNAPKANNADNIGELIRTSYLGQDKILRYFLNSTWDNRLFLLLVCAGFFWWVYINFRMAGRPKLAAEIGEMKFSYIAKVPILSTLVVLFNITPLFEPNSPSIYIELNQFFLLVTLSIFLQRRLLKEQMRVWYTIMGLYALVIFTNAFVNESFLLRSLLIALNGVSIYFGIWLYRKLREASFHKKFIKPVVIIYVILNISAILLNVFGRISLAKSFHLTAISGLVQVLSLAVFVEIVAEAIELQMKVSSCSGGLFARINVAHSRAKFRKILSFISVLLWIMVFAINLNIIDPIVDLLQQLLIKPRTFGSITFSLGNILFFAVIVYLANLLQKNIGLLFGESDSSFGATTVEKNSKLALIRLVIIVLGFLFAVTASGVPLDKITVLLGALGVGIGLGLQNIINNFVSGIILIFEKPFKIGDYIELADKKGKVLDIGIRSSKMLTSQGSRVIIPNGDLLSGRLVNYTQKNSQLKSEILFKVHVESDLDLVKKLVTETIDKGEEIVKNAPKQVLFNNIGADFVELKILVWVKSVYSEAAFKSYVLETLYRKFKENGIKVM
ncbi:mechanosensitive ion channel family protein [Dyadobacter sp. CY323]|uniref:mechanosensitive ion channel family protein n=1 Tax=Dyadobacter sp. CY323 TaxID=2907302 RepID=UPI001F36E00A|nr:mechanosensitive ion channel domain-containing protein [Dyadobacter sp. CY323]MCE6992624.1 mechanosensitive ion channel [Dyadobacter sp. CY323]